MPAYSLQTGFPKFPKLESERLILREMTYDDLDFYYRHFSIKEIVEGSGFPAPKTLEDAKHELDMFIIDLFKEGKGFRWGIALKGRKELIGTCGFYNLVADSRKATIGYDLNPAYWGRGIMREALNEIIRFGFEELRLNRIQCTILPENARSTRVVTGLGFTREGVLRENAIFEGRFQDDVVFSLLRREWTGGKRRV